ncbi:hypothetical protein N7475_000017 [Penicillium sp. IBT 31633x]|nr:hypothetical protein N7475_000017 [Penicillium sp. IBT 31633x]
MPQAAISRHSHKYPLPTHSPSVQHSPHFDLNITPKNLPLIFRRAFFYSVVSCANISRAPR